MECSPFYPKVTIVIPVYNGANYLGNAINCALAQTYQNVEVLVVNDGSTDNGETERIARSYGDRIRYFYKPNGGVSSALNLGIQNMTGDYFSWLSHDDAYTAYKIEDSVNALREAGATDGRTVAYSAGNFIDNTGEILKLFKANLVIGRVYTGNELLYYAVNNGTMNGCCMLIPKAVFDECGRFDETLRYSQDALMWFQMYLQGFGLVYDGKPNVMYRLHPSQTSRTKHELFEKDAGYIAELLAPKFREVSTRSENILYRYALHMAKYRCENVVNIIRRYADGECAFSAMQEWNLRAVLFYGRMRGTLKKIYYRFFLGVKV